MDNWDDIGKVNYENISRKVDSLGRISVPSGLRSRFEIEAGDELSFGTMQENGANFIVMTKLEDIDKVRYNLAADVLKELGCEIPKILEEKL